MYVVACSLRAQKKLIWSAAWYSASAAWSS
jgi:hypothetical protein